MTDRIAIVTGAAQGLGAAIAARLASEFDVLVLADLQDEPLGIRAQSIENEHRVRVIAHQTDVTSPASVTALYDAVAGQGSLTGLVNVAGIGGFDPIVSIDEALWDRMFAVNTKGTFLMCQEFLRRVPTGPAAIVNISSIGAKQGHPLLGHYAAAKAAVIEFSHVVARTGAANEIRCNTVMPGLIHTDMWKSSIPALKAVTPPLADLPDDQVFEAMVQQSVPMGRPQEPEDIAEAVAFLISDRARNITGQTLAVDGGAVLT
ncbi:SDR family NAD(P)-dependent oxidoreductase [Microbacterium koreense]|uniref:SDR family NAD(P)-dependent oxidoreductase n=1 Tax=Microbacterium koreense TaxID=323761 RepID=A0ABW2ZRI6_9MICO